MHISAAHVDLAGVISADGLAGVAGAGGGSGGSVLVNASLSFSGAGTLSARGGDAEYYVVSTPGAGGGGGRLAVYVGAAGSGMSFFGPVDATGGARLLTTLGITKSAGPGTIYLNCFWG